MSQKPKHNHKREETKSDIVVKDLNFYYGKHRALTDLNLRFRKENVSALIGPSGCGKSTLLRIFNRIYHLYPGQHAEGSILIHGQEILGPKVDFNWLRTSVGMVFQKPTPFPMSIFDNVAFAVRKLENPPKAELAERVEWALNKAALWDEVKDSLKKGGGDLSGGQQQRLCIARTIALKPLVLLLDEPTSALDPLSTRKIEELVAELKDEFKIIIVTHNMAQAKRVSDETLFMIKGEGVEFRPTSELFEDPRDDRTRAYIKIGDL